VQGLIFKPEIWKTLIPRVVSAARLVLSQIFDGKDWEVFLTTALPLINIRISGGTDDVHFQVQQASGDVSSDSLKLSPQLNEMDQDHLSSIVEFCLHGLGLGSMRYSETLGLQDFQVLWGDGALYFYAKSSKKWKAQSKLSTELTQQKLPKSISRIVLLFRLSMSLRGGDLSSFVPVRSDRKDLMKDFVQSLFCLPIAPDDLQVRHFFASLSNYLFPMQDDGKATTSDMVAMQSHHAPSTHASTYFTHRKAHLEDYYDVYHFHLGDQDTQWTFDIPLDVLPENTIVAALKILYGGEANWLSETQRSMVLTWSTLSKNVIANLPCGGGKSAVWEVTAYARHRVGLTRKCAVVVVPYKFLAYNHYHSAKSKFELLDGVSVDMLESSAVCSNQVPTILKSDVLPHILFLTVDALAKLLEFHLPIVQSMQSRLAGFVIDECHCPYTETFRSVFDCLQDLSMFAVPICALSGTLPSAFPSSLMKYYGVSVFETVADSDCIGDGFSLSIKQCHDEVAAVTRKVVQERIKSSRNAIHIIAASARVAELLFQQLCSKSFQCLLVTSQTPEVEQDSICQAWRDGKVDVLISTTIALVGVESSRCLRKMISGCCKNICE
jgi:hypothetical protein